MKIVGQDCKTLSRYYTSLTGSVLSTHSELFTYLSRAQRIFEIIIL